MRVFNKREGLIDLPRHSSIELTPEGHNGPPIDFPFLDLRHLTTEAPAPFDFVVPGLMAGTVGALVSPGGTGKSMLALQMALGIASGVDLLGLGCQTSRAQPVVFLGAEDQTAVLHARIYAMSQGLDVDLPTVWRHLRIASLAGKGVDLMDDAWHQLITTTTANSRLIVFDTLRRFHTLDENDSGVMTVVLARLEIIALRTGAAILFLHHTSKAGATVAGDTQQASRGSSVLTDNIRFQANLVGMSAQQASDFGLEEGQRRHHVRLSFPKINYCAPIPDQWFVRREHGLLQPVTLQSQESQSFKKPASKSARNSARKPAGQKGRVRDEF